MSVHTLEVALQRSRDPVRPASEDADLDFLVRLLERRGSVRRSGILALVETWGSIAELFAADPGELRRSGLDPVLVQDLVDLRALAVELTRLEASRRPVVSSWSALIAYVRAALAHAPREQFRVLFLDKRNRLLHDELRAEGPNNGILDNVHVYTAFSALDPLTQDKVSRLTGTILETRTSRSGPSMFGSGRGSVSRSEVERPLLEPGEVRALPDDEQLVFVAGQKPLRANKLQYDRRSPFRSRAGETLPDQSLRLDGPPRPFHPWAGRRALGRDEDATLPLFKEVAAAMEDKKTVAAVAGVMGRVAREMAADQAVLDQLQGGGHAQD